MNAYFQANDLSTCWSNHSEVEHVKEKFDVLFQMLRRNIRNHQWNLFSHWDRNAQILNHSVSGQMPYGFSAPLLRSREQALLVERMMGRDGVGTTLTADIYRHPLIELRVTPDYVALEYILAPNAWLDQRNLIGKLTIARYREEFRQLVKKLDRNFIFGFWEGASLSQERVTCNELLKTSYFLHDWMSTFADGQDFMRVGAWYAHDDLLMDADTILKELTNKLSQLLMVYEFATWTSNNNYQRFHPHQVIMPPSRGRDTQF